MKIVYYNQEKKHRNWIKIAILCATTAAALWSFFWLPYFRISQIKINDPLVDRGEIEEKLSSLLASFTKFYLPKNNYFFFPKEAAEKIILESGIGVANIQKKFPNKILVDFKEIKPKFLYCKEDSCFYIDKNGVPYESAPFFSNSPIPVLEVNKDIKLGEIFLETRIANFLIEFEKEIQKLGLKLKQVKIDQDIRLITSEDWYLILSLKSDMEDAQNIAKKLTLLFERTIKDRTNLEYIDMRFPNKAFYKIRIEI
ncbi:MAG: hypothetical protein AAB522_01685 [Patescibacteria group bacterium]